MACRYVHELRGNDIAYIVTTLKTWGKPLKKGRFEIILPSGYELESSNYNFLKTNRDNKMESDKNMWYLDVVDFYPDEDIKASIIKKT